MIEGTPNKFEIPADMRKMAENGIEQARKAFDNFFEAAQRASTSFELPGGGAFSGAKDIGNKAVSFAEQNVKASLDYAQNLAKAKDVTEVMKLHSEYLQGQMRALAQQASEMGQAVTKVAMDAGKK